MVDNAKITSKRLDDIQEKDKSSALGTIYGDELIDYFKNVILEKNDTDKFDDEDMNQLYEYLKSYNLKFKEYTDIYVHFPKDKKIEDFLDEEINKLESEINKLESNKGKSKGFFSKKWERFPIKLMSLILLEKELVIELKKQNNDLNLSTEIVNEQRFSSKSTKEEFNNLKEKDNKLKALIYLINVLKIKGGHYYYGDEEQRTYAQNVIHQLEKIISSMFTSVTSLEYNNFKGNKFIENLHKLIVFVINKLKPPKKLKNFKVDLKNVFKKKSGGDTKQTKLAQNVIYQLEKIISSMFNSSTFNSSMFNSSTRSENKNSEYQILVNQFLGNLYWLVHLVKNNLLICGYGTNITKLKKETYSRLKSLLGNNLLFRSSSPNNYTKKRIKESKSVLSTQLSPTAVIANTPPPQNTDRGKRIRYIKDTIIPQIKNMINNNQFIKEKEYVNNLKKLLDELYKKIKEKYVKQLDSMIVVTEKLSNKEPFEKILKSLKELRQMCNGLYNTREQDNTAINLVKEMRKKKTRMERRRRERRIITLKNKKK